MSKLPRDDNGVVSTLISYNEPVHRSVQISGAAANLTADLLVDNRVSILIQSLSTNTDLVYIGFDDTVTAAHNGGTGGYELPVGQSISFDLAPTSQSKLRDVYAIAASGTQELRIMEI